MNLCFECSAPLLNAVYSGEVWEATEDVPYEMLPILESWWDGDIESDSVHGECCVKCAIRRAQFLFDATIIAVKELTALGLL